MTTLQKVIKYLALALAVFIIVNIISAILFVFYGFANVLGLAKSKEVNISSLEEISTNFENSDIATLKIELEYSNLTIKKGDTFKAQSNSSDISCTQNNNQLVVKEKSHNWFAKNKASDLIVYIPENTMFDTVKIEAGAGEIKIEDLKTQKLSFKIGAGKVEIQNLEVTKQAKIDGGAGKVDILAGTINDLDLDMGVGSFSLAATLTGKNDIDAGVGKLDINLTDGTQNYTIKADKGIGAIIIDGKEVGNNTEHGNGDTYIDIDGGIGSISVK